MPPHSGACTHLSVYSSACCRLFEQHRQEHSSKQLLKAPGTCMACCRAESCPMQHAGGM